MSVRILSADQMRWADMTTTEAGIPGFELMDRAGRAVADAVLDYMPDFGRVVIVIGPGNNGGDGFAAARYLRSRRIPVTLVMLVPLDTLGGDTLMHAELAREAGAKLRDASSDRCFAELNRWLLRAVMVVDAMFGTGLTRPLSGRLAKAVAQINQADRPVLSIDIASGLNADSGEVMGDAVKADFTLPVAAYKWGYWMGVGPEFSGRLLPASAIGVEDETLCRAWAAVPDPSVSKDSAALRSACFIHSDMIGQAWPKRHRLSHKGNFGRVWIFGGSAGFTGAPRLASLGALAAGAGLVSVVCPDDVYPVVASGSLETMVHSQSSGAWMREGDGLIDQADAIVAGPGWGCAQTTLLARLLDVDRPLLLDADALNMIAADAALQARVSERDSLTVLTPHPGEAARLLSCTVDDIQSDRKKAVLKLCKRYACWVVLKGNETLIASPQGDVMLNPSGSPQLAVAGSGDVLAGMLGRQLAVCYRNDTDVGMMLGAGVGLHGEAGEQNGWYLAGELAGMVAGLRQGIERKHGD
ncbi:bifunctional ADP-dependent NAD(P)H-hydrate dehydratase/NAD(P)H-hydrate epimerase [Mariprofundus ferrooxydans]|uniref:bifunctional ADP-dependent NAD(P)H-hydrate dehydratase/NAD(P)H-hydrate epimerase n=1 Tax=Mariprofundus ferrooxydans TaxID=314344 RepID=UPI0003761895|nr:bifunctional ADP-dependent NAD(P)H-hydrate dehydratase/NAD(P)H-hydrate epimerase [Mariprofundus ferrooxydans]